MEPRICLSRSRIVLEVFDGRRASNSNVATEMSKRVVELALQVAWQRKVVYPLAQLACNRLTLRFITTLFKMINELQSFWVSENDTRKTIRGYDRCVGDLQPRNNA